MFFLIVKKEDILENVDKEIIKTMEKKIKAEPDYLSFYNANTKEYTHCYHSYPAMMIPQIAREFINITKKANQKIKNIFDPFMGSGTTLVEGMIQNLKGYGIDINPLAYLMAKTKTTPIEPEYLKNNVEKLLNNINQKYNSYLEGTYKIENLPKFDRIDFWFKPKVIELLQLIKNCIIEFEDEQIKNFYLATFSETVRYVSNTRNNEFKLYRMPPEKLKEWNPDVVNIFKDYLKRNCEGNNIFYEEISKFGNFTSPIIVTGSSENLPFSDNSFDLLITSPPYGDSKTTVAYGQFSRLSSQWLDLEIDENKKINQLDNVMLGGKVEKNLNASDELDKLNSETLRQIFNEIYSIDKKRAFEVLQFYIDLDKTLNEVARVMKINSYQFWVVANRTVKGITILTDEIIIEMFKKYGICHIHRFYRKIPNKRMPLKNSPTNQTGKLSKTMTSEIIIMFKKIK